MRLFFCMLAMLPAIAFGSGKLSLQNNFYDEGRTYRPMVGLGIYEKVPLLPLHFNSWTGYGNQPLELKDDVDWFTSKNQLDMTLMGRVTVSPGVQFTYIKPWNEKRVIYYVKVDYKLW